MMTEGEKVQEIRILKRNDLVQDERISSLERQVSEMKEILKSPLRRGIYAARQGKQQESD